MKIRVNTNIINIQMSKRIYTNREIQETIANVISKFSQSDLDKYCRQDYSKMVFDINFPLILKVPDYYTYTEKSEAVKDEGGMNRWTWKFEFRKNGYTYAITTQWYARHDEDVQRWLRKHSL
jgi:phosphomevalonate kinase